MSKIALLVLMCGMMCYGRHVHPRSLVHTQGEMLDRTSDPFTEDIPIDVLTHLKPTRFVPINSAIFFKNFPPCDPGFERDVIGVCREVWD